MKKSRHEVEMDRMYDKLAKLEPGTDEYKAMFCEILKAREVDNECKKVDNDFTIKTIVFGAGIVLTPIVDLLCKRNLAKYIGKVEQMETFVSSAGRSISSWFRFK